MHQRCYHCLSTSPEGGFYHTNPATGDRLPLDLALCRDCYEDACRRDSARLALAARARGQVTPIQGDPRRKPPKRGRGVASRHGAGRAD